MFLSEVDTVRHLSSKLVSDDEIERAAKAPFFAGLPLEAVRELLAGATVGQYTRHALLFSEGDRADRFYLVLEGKVKLFTTSENGDESVVEIFGPVRTFAEAAMFASGVFPVSAEVVESSLLVQMKTNTFLKSLETHKDLAFMLLATMARRHRGLVRDLADLKSKSPGQRLGSFLLGLAIDQGAGRTIHLPFDKVLIAGKLGMKPESLSRTLARLRQIGVTSNRNEVTISDLEALRRFCGEADLDDGE
ncbi:MAG: cyclic nucleotide-binding domain-containing protein [Hyphomicrobiales bacterium]|nr:cyclic nucleotide-binding domain-containing protein [Hyphomicrobiales bacterium]